MNGVDEMIRRLSAVAENPDGYVAEWKRVHDRKAIAILPMNFPAELIHAAGALPATKVS